jgi:hypothetical protein
MEAEVHTHESEHDDDDDLGHEVEDPKANFVEVPGRWDRTTCSIEHWGLRNPGNNTAEGLSSS